LKLRHTGMVHKRLHSRLLAECDGANGIPRSLLWGEFIGGSGEFIGGSIYKIILRTANSKIQIQAISKSLVLQRPHFVYIFSRREVLTLYSGILLQRWRLAALLSHISYLTEILRFH